MVEFDLEGFKYDTKMPMKIAIFNHRDFPFGADTVMPTEIFYKSKGQISRIWQCDSKAIRGKFLEQPVPSLLPNNVRMDPPIKDNGYIFQGIWPGHIFAHFPERRREELELNGIYLVGRSAELNYDRIDESILKIKKKLEISE